MCLCMQVHMYVLCALCVVCVYVWAHMYVHKNTQPRWYFVCVLSPLQQFANDHLRVQMAQLETRSQL